MEAAARATELKVEMKYLEHETHLRRIQLEKEIALADAEEEVIKLDEVQPRTSEARPGLKLSKGPKGGV